MTDRDANDVDPLAALLGCDDDELSPALAAKLARIGIDTVAETMAINQMFAVLAASYARLPEPARQACDPAGLWPFPGFERGGPHYRFSRLLVDDLGRLPARPGHDLGTDGRPLETYRGMLARFRQVWSERDARRLLGADAVDFIAGRTATE